MELRTLSASSTTVRLICFSNHHNQQQNEYRKEDEGRETSKSPSEIKETEDEKEVDEDDEGPSIHVNKETGEVGGPKGLEPTRYGDWERSGRCSDF